MEDNQVISKALEHRKYVLREFIESEREYVRRLHMAMEDYYYHIKSGKSDNISTELKNDISSIFSTMPDIYAFHKNVFLPSLEGCNWEEDAGAVMECFLKHNLEFKIYLAFCKGKPTSDSVRVDHERYFTSRQGEIGQKLNIDDLLIAPVQRLPKYQLLIRDLLKDTRKAQLDSAKIEEALELMMKIPQETNNIICMSLIRGINRARIISHGSLWRQNTFGFSCSSSSWANEDQVSTSHCKNKMEPRQIYLFDHRILIAAPADSDGFYDYQMDLKTLNGRVAEEEDVFSFTTENNVMCYFKPSNETSRKKWVSDIRAILESQLQMKKALIFGKPVAHMESVRTHSLSVEWSDSDSSVDSMPSSSDEVEDHEYDWPVQTGFQNINKILPKSPLLSTQFSLPPPAITKEKKEKKKLNKLMKMSHFESASPPSSRKISNTEAAVSTRGMELLSLTRPHSWSVDSFDQSMQRSSHTLSVSPRLLRQWVARKLSTQKEAFVYFPTQSLSPFTRARSPSAGARPYSLPSPSEVLFITRDDPPAVAEQVYSPRPGQVFLIEDDSSVDVLKVKVLSGDDAGDSVWVQKNCLEEYAAPISTKALKKNYLVLNLLSTGRYSKLKLARSKVTKELHALKIFRADVTEDQFYRELCISTRMKHKNLISYFIGFQQPSFSIAMEYINGYLILDYLTHKASVTEKMVANLMSQLLDGLCYMHSHTVYHLDIRPENILVDLTSDVLKIIDYGAARHSGDVDSILSQNFETAFKYDYVAPELFQHHTVGSWTDMWGVGIVVYTIFHGSTPFHGDSAVRTIANITSLRGPFLDSQKEESPCSPHATQLIRDILVLPPSHRPSAEVARQSNWFTDKSQDLVKNRVNLYQLKQFLMNPS